LIYCFCVKGISAFVIPVIQGCFKALLASYLSEAG
jgi:hypothetical protein